jgi:hypothetical protein
MHMKLVIIGMKRPGKVSEVVILSRLDLTVKI